MKNTLGHDNESEVLTIIARLREKKFKISQFDENQIFFNIILTHHNTVPVPNTYTIEIKFKIIRESIEMTYKYYLKQLNGVDVREIPFADGYVIWSLLEEKLELKSKNWDDIESEYYKQTGDTSSHEIFTEWLKFHYKVPEKI